MSAPDCAARVAAGAVFLDGRMPGWAERIDLDSLNLMDDCYCVLGQLGGCYHAVVTELGLSIGEEISLGFMAGGTGAWDLLDAAWTAEVRKRHDADWADEWDSADSSAYQDRVEAGLEETGPEYAAEVAR
jgi:hypothetical protein